MTQKERVLDYINRFGSITRLDAFKDLGVAELSARICELKKEGHEFETKSETTKNRFGEPVTYTRYFKAANN